MSTEEQQIRFGEDHLQLAENYWQRLQNGTEDRHRLEGALKGNPGPDRNQRATMEEQLGNVYADLAECRTHFQHESILASLHFQAVEAKAVAVHSQIARDLVNGVDTELM